MQQLRLCNWNGIDFPLMRLTMRNKILLLKNTWLTGHYPLLLKSNQFLWDRQRMCFHVAPLFFVRVVSDCLTWVSLVKFVEHFHCLSSVLFFFSTERMVVQKGDVKHVRFFLFDWGKNKILGFSTGIVRATRIRYRWNNISIVDFGLAMITCWKVVSACLDFIVHRVLQSLSLEKDIH